MVLLGYTEIPAIRVDTYELQKMLNLTLDLSVSHIQEGSSYFVSANLNVYNTTPLWPSMLISVEVSTLRTACPSREENIYILECNTQEDDPQENRQHGCEHEVQPGKHL